MARPEIRSDTNHGDTLRLGAEMRMVGGRPLGLYVSGLGQSKNRGPSDCEAYPGFCNPLGSHLAQ